MTREHRRKVFFTICAELFQLDKPKKLVNNIANNLTLTLLCKELRKYAKRADSSDLVICVIILWMFEYV